MPIIKAGEEFRVSSRTIGDQLDPAIAVDADGNFTIVWEEDTSTAVNQYKKVYAQRFDAEGVRIGQERNLTNIFAPKTLFIPEFNPSIAMNADGDLAIALSRRGDFPFSTTNDIVTHFFPSEGPSSARFANTTKLGEQIDPSIAMNDNGDYVVVWQSPDGDRDGIYAQRFSADGSPQGNQILINNVTQGEQYDPIVDIHTDGSFVVTWMNRSQANQGLDVYARQFNANGAPKGDQFLINITTEQSQEYPFVVTTPTGGFIVAWEDEGQNDENGAIFVRRFDADGTPLSGEILVNIYAEDLQETPTLAVDQFGNFLVTWQSYSEDGSDYGVYARRFRADGTPVSDPFQVNTFTENDQNYATSAMQPNGDFVIAWESTDQDGDGYGVYAQRFELASTVVFSQPVYQVAENGAQALLVLDRLDELHLTTQIQINITGGSATAGQDYAIALQTITFNPGETRKTIAVDILQDNQIESVETIDFSLVGIDRALLGDVDSATLAIVDDDIPTIPGGRPNPGLGNPGNSNASNTNQRPPQVGSNRKDRLTGTELGDLLIGLGGSDIIRAKGGNDVVIGVNPNGRRPGKGEIDTMLGNQGQDLFIVGDEERAYYDDGKRNNAGLKDFALIKGFNGRQDTIQLHGRSRDYRLGASPKGKGTAIFLETGSVDELVAVIRGGGNLNLNSNDFEFV